MKVCGFIPVLIFSSYFSVCANEDEEVLCVYGEHCVLPCSFTPGSDPVIEWIKTENDLTVHSFRQGQTQEQYPYYSGRTSVFEEEINRGNASLLLRRVTIQDQGRFFCWADEQVTYVNMKVFAPVSEVHMNPMDKKLICWADDIFPKPDVTWIMNPEPPYEPGISIESSKGLFSVYSSVPVPQSPPFQYSCNISTAYSWKSETYEIEKERFNLGIAPWISLGWCLFLSLGCLTCGTTMWIKRRRLNVRHSKVVEILLENKNASSRKLRAYDGTVAGPVPEKEHLGPNNPEKLRSDRDWDSVEW